MKRPFTPNDDTLAIAVFAFGLGFGLAWMIYGCTG